MREKKEMRGKREENIGGKSAVVREFALEFVPVGHCGSTDAYPGPTKVQ